MVFSEPPRRKLAGFRRAMGGSVLRRLKQLGTVLLYLGMIVAILALWNSNAPQFIYVAF